MPGQERISGETGPAPANMYFLDIESLRSHGFHVDATGGTVRLIKGHCEIHVHGADHDLALTIPVARLFPGDKISGELERYLAERNEHHGGPGRFEVIDGYIIYRGQATLQDVCGVADQMVSAVERIGPKILRMLR